MKKTQLILIVLLSFLLIFAATCNKEKETSNTEKERREEIDELKSELNDIGETISEIFEKEREGMKENAKESMIELLDKIDQKIETLKGKLANSKEDKDLEERLEALQYKANKLEKEIESLKDESTEEWQQIKNKFQSLLSDIEKDIEKIGTDR
ncbi:MAG: hypothetical protein ACOC4B_02220 [Bacteroidota bacterium]